MVGQHIRILKGGQWFHAIDCGDETVLHLAEEAPPPRVRRAYRPEFVAGAQAVEIVTHRERTFPAKEIVRRAYSRASDPALAAMFRDSEAFAEWCTIGRVPGVHNVALTPPGAPEPAQPAAPAVKANGRKAPPAVKAGPRPKAKAGAKAPAKTLRKTRVKAKPSTKAKRSAKAKPAVKLKARAAKAASARKAAAKKPVRAKRTAARKKGRR